MGISARRANRTIWLWKKNNQYIKTYDIEPQLEATYPSEDTVWRWLKMHLAGLPLRGIGLAGLELIERRMAKENPHA
ncbi:hypothetical protein Mesil_1900 [Allomeiothermus silvanus DSM 9946]|uniref:Uncharacterized protein n=1 Tax=Allomeiothermus silvanus (strain ATCC 700542 / DSM 9946 / NBRC 106475 / NCIMB 13440 / VI-R2) TaxID=526227 RepID=D7BGF9_ALLS1|nr:hypothetical protein [Allomeiothermus silvanus]ADH63775.1 hypothetical protein Mesil_1900 [Allomeiothermus silvanus DSM 9946]